LGAEKKKIKNNNKNKKEEGKVIANERGQRRSKK